MQARYYPGETIQGLVHLDITHPDGVKGAQRALELSVRWGVGGEHVLAHR